MSLGVNLLLGLVRQVARALDPDYEWAVVGEPGRRYLWILSREPRMDGATETMIRGLITDAGYDVERLQPTARAP